MDEWLNTKSTPWLDVIVNREARTVKVCPDCGEQDATWRCLDCVGAPDICRACCKASHRRNPLHRIEWWNGKSFQPAWLWQVGTVLCLGHGGGLCPQYHSTLSTIEDRALVHNNCMDNPSVGQDDHTYGAVPDLTVFGSGHVVTVVHVNGYHHLPVYPCLCHHEPRPTNVGLDVPPAEEHAPDPRKHSGQTEETAKSTGSTVPPTRDSDFARGTEDVQFLEAGFFPASWKKVSTVFTFELLKDFHLTKVEAKMSTEDYCDILARKTNFAFPDSAPVRCFWVDVITTDCASETRSGTRTSMATIQLCYSPQAVRLCPHQPRKASRRWRSCLVLCGVSSTWGQPSTRLER